MSSSARCARILWIFGQLHASSSYDMTKLESSVRHALRFHAVHSPSIHLLPRLYAAFAEFWWLGQVREDLDEILNFANTVQSLASNTMRLYTLGSVCRIWDFFSDLSRQIQQTRHRACTGRRLILVAWVPRTVLLSSKRHKREFSGYVSMGQCLQGPRLRVFTLSNHRSQINSGLCDSDIIIWAYGTTYYIYIYIRFKFSRSDYY